MSAPSDPGWVVSRAGTLAETIAAGGLDEQASDVTEICFRVMMHAFCVMVGDDDDDDQARLATILAEARAWAWEGVKTGRTQHAAP